MSALAGRTVCLAVAFASFVASACKDSGTEPEPFVPAATGLVISGGGREVYVESEIGLNASVNDQRGSSMTGEPILWISRDVTTATVDAGGMVRGVAAGDVIGRSHLGTGGGTGIQVASGPSTAHIVPRSQPRETR